MKSKNILVLLITCTLSMTIHTADLTQKKDSFDLTALKATMLAVKQQMHKEPVLKFNTDRAQLASLQEIQKWATQEHKAKDFTLILWNHGDIDLLNCD